MTEEKSPTTAALAVEYFHTLPGVGPANVMWRGRWPMRGGSFPREHPVGGTSLRDNSMQLGTSGQMAAFRAKGYWASCFPEGDGMIVQTDRDADSVAADIKECFGWRVKIKRA